jgi:hypothetical protein
MQIFVLSRDIDGRLTSANEMLKQNAAVYLNQFRLANESLEIVDGSIVNLGIDFTITTESGFNRTNVLANCLLQVRELMNVKNFNFAKNLILSEIENAIHDNEGVRSVVDVKVFNISGGTHSDVAYDVASNVQNGELNCPEDSMFEVRYLELDISGKVA